MAMVTAHFPASPVFPPWKSRPYGERRSKSTPGARCRWVTDLTKAQAEEVLDRLEVTGRRGYLGFNGESFSVKYWL